MRIRLFKVSGGTQPIAAIVWSIFLNFHCILSSWAQYSEAAMLANGLHLPFTEWTNKRRHPKVCNEFLFRPFPTNKYTVLIFFLHLSFQNLYLNLYCFCSFNKSYLSASNDALSLTLWIIILLVSLLALHRISYRLSSKQNGKMKIFENITDLIARLAGKKGLKSV